MKYLNLFLISIVFVSCADKKEEKKQETKSNFPAPVVPEEKKIVTDGTEQTFYPNGQLKTEGQMEKGKREGRWVSFYENGLPWSETHFKNGVRDGATTTWYENGQKRYTGFYTNNKPSGKWIFWDDQGNVAQEVNYDK